MEVFHSIKDLVATRGSGYSNLLVRRPMQITVFCIGFAVLLMFLICNYPSPFRISTISNYFNGVSTKAIIITNLNDAWAEPGSIFDVFRESFRIGNETQRFLNHLVVINWDQKAQDTDVMWLRNPFKHFQEDADFQTSCDYFTGNSSDMNNAPNTGFSYVKSNEKTIWLYKFWFNSSKLYPNLHDQDAFNMIKIHPNISSMNLKIRFLSTTYFGGFCRPSDDFNQVCTMHANCCVGLDNKVNDLKILLQDWKNYMALPQIEKQQSHRSWTVPQLCRTSFQRMHQRHNKR
ncbi:hypothetical protein AHAS_Ahas05G0251600 [Arachis hypogaea]